VWMLGWGGGGVGGGGGGGGGDWEAGVHIVLKYR